MGVHAKSNKVFVMEEGPHFVEGPGNNSDVAHRKTVAAAVYQSGYQTGQQHLNPAYYISPVNYDQVPSHPNYYQLAAPPVQMEIVHNEAIVQTQNEPVVSVGASEIPHGEKFFCVICQREFGKMFNFEQHKRNVCGNLGRYGATSAANLTQYRRI